jgi:hypothetical protein
MGHHLHDGMSSRVSFRKAVSNFSERKSLHVIVLPASTFSRFANAQRSTQPRNPPFSPPIPFLSQPCPQKANRHRRPAPIHPNKKPRNRNLGGTEPQGTERECSVPQRSDATPASLAWPYVHGFVSVSRRPLNSEIVQGVLKSVALGIDTICSAGCCSSLGVFRLLSILVKSRSLADVFVR